MKFLIIFILFLFTSCRCECVDCEYEVCKMYYTIDGIEKSSYVIKEIKKDNTINFLYHIHKKRRLSINGHYIDRGNINILRFECSGKRFKLKNE